MSQIDKNKKTIEAYDKNSQYYADKFDSYGVRVQDIDRAIKLNESKSDKVLELGCGSGRDAQYIISRVSCENYIGVDASLGLIKLAREKISEGEFHVKDIRKLVFEPESLGIIFSFASVLHVNHEELADLIDKCHKWLKIGGILYISTKYGEYREIEIENLGDKKYYYAYTPEDIVKMAGSRFEVIYNVIQDSYYGPELVIAIKKKQ